MLKGKMKLGVNNRVPDSYQYLFPVGVENNAARCGLGLRFDNYNYYFESSTPSRYNHLSRVMKRLPVQIQGGGHKCLLHTISIKIRQHRVWSQKMAQLFPLGGHCTLEFYYQFYSLETPIIYLEC